MKKNTCIAQTQSGNIVKWFAIIFVIVYNKSFVKCKNYDSICLRKRLAYIQISFFLLSFEISYEYSDWWTCLLSNHQNYKIDNYQRTKTNWETKWQNYSLCKTHLTFSTMFNVHTAHILNIRVSTFICTSTFWIYRYVIFLYGIIQLFLFLNFIDAKSLQSLSSVVPPQPNRDSIFFFI